MTSTSQSNDRLPVVQHGIHQHQSRRELVRVAEEKLREVDERIKFLSAGLEAGTLEFDDIGE